MVGWLRLYKNLTECLSIYFTWLGNPGDRDELFN